MMAAQCSAGPGMMPLDILPVASVVKSYAIPAGKASTALNVSGISQQLNCVIVPQ